MYLFFKGTELNLELQQWRRQEFYWGGGKKCRGLGLCPRKFLFDHALYFGYKRDQRPFVGWDQDKKMCWSTTIIVPQLENEILLSIYDFFTSEMETHPPPIFSSNFEELRGPSFSTLGGNRPSLPLLAPPCRCHWTSRGPCPLDPLLATGLL